MYSRVSITEVKEALLGTAVFLLLSDGVSFLLLTDGVSLLQLAATDTSGIVATDARVSVVEIPSM